MKGPRETATGTVSRAPTASGRRWDSNREADWDRPAYPAARRLTRPVRTHLLSRRCPGRHLLIRRRAARCQVTRVIATHPDPPALGPGRRLTSPPVVRPLTAAAPRPCSRRRYPRRTRGRPRPRPPAPPPPLRRGDPWARPPLRRRASPLLPVMSRTSTDHECTGRRIPHSYATVKDRLRISLSHRCVL